MAQKLYEESNIQAIADAIRAKNGLTDTYKTSDMAGAIIALESGSGGNIIPPEAFYITGNCQRRFTMGHWDWIINKYGDKIVTENIQDAEYMFADSGVTEIPFDLNFDSSKPCTTGFMFQNCSNLQTIGDLKNLRPKAFSSMFNNCVSLTEIPNFIDVDTTYLESNTSISGSSCFNSCRSLRSIPEWLLDLIGSATTISQSYYLYSGGFGGCATLNELTNLPVFENQIITTSMGSYSGSFGDCFMLKNITYKTNEDGTPKIVSWKNQTIDISKNVGWVYNAYAKGLVLNYNSGVTADKEVNDDVTYAALKNDPDWFATKFEYCKYNLDSAVATIQSLPDTSVYLASAGGTNTIKFTGAAGSATDGGAINTMSEETIALAASKGWTVTFV